MEPMCFSTARLVRVRLLGNGAVAHAARHQREHLAFARRELVDRGALRPPSAFNELMHHDRVDNRAALGDYLDGVQQIGPIVQPFLEQICTPVGVGPQQGHGERRLCPLAERDQAHLGTLAP